MNTKDTILDTIIITIILTTLISRIITLPLNISIVAGNSMLPTLHPGDLVISTPANNLNNNDIVIWCNTISYCVIHRITNITNTHVITKGDNNPLPDPPIPINLVKYKVILTIPLTTWLPLTLFTTAYYAFTKRREIIKIFTNATNDTETIVLTIFLLIDLAFISFIPIHYFSAQSVIIKPSIELKSIQPSNNNVLITYTLINTKIISIPESTIHVNNETYETQTQILDNTILIYIPTKIYQKAYELNAEKITIHLKILLDKGYVIGNYTHYIEWKPLTITILNNSITIHNPNYAKITIYNITITYYTQNHLTKIENLPPITINPQNNYTLNIKTDKNTTAYIKFTYNLRGRTIIESKQI